MICICLLFYDIAKLSHSILGGYDYIINNRSSIDYNFDMQVSSILNICKEDIFIFKKFLQRFNFNYYHVRLVEASLFLSMLPLHIDNQRKVFLLALRGIEILNVVKHREDS